MDWCPLLVLFQQQQQQQLYILFCVMYGCLGVGGGGGVCESVGFPPLQQCLSLTELLC